MKKHITQLTTTDCNIIKTNPLKIVSWSWSVTCCPSSIHRPWMRVEWNYGWHGHHHTHIHINNTHRNTPITDTHRRHVRKLPLWLSLYDHHSFREMYSFAVTGEGSGGLTLVICVVCDRWNDTGSSNSVVSMFGPGMLGVAHRWCPFSSCEGEVGFICQVPTHINYYW